jgi:hypothetical protein
LYGMKPSFLNFFKCTVIRLTNAFFLVASIRYPRAVHPRLHVGGFFLGLAASIALVRFCAQMLS